MNTNKVTDAFNLDIYMYKYKSHCIPSGFLDYILSVNNIFIMFNSSPTTAKTGHWLCIFETAKKTKFWSSWPTVCILHASHQKLSWDKGKIYYSKLEVSTRFINQKLWCSYTIIIYFPSHRYTCSGFLSIYVVNSRLNDFLVEHSFSYLYNIDFSHLKGKCFKNCLWLCLWIKPLCQKSVSFRFLLPHIGNHR